MRYLCLNCETRFEHDADDAKKLRCPKCMRVTGLEKIEDGKAKAPERPWLVPAAVGGVLVVLLGGYAVWRSSQPTAVEGDAPLRPLEPSELEGYLRAEHADAHGLASLLDPGEAIEGFASAAVRGETGPTDRAAALLAAFRQKAEEERFVRWSMGVPREAPPATAAAAFEWLGEEDARARLYPLEAAAIMVAALRSQGIDAMLAEIHRFPGDDAPPDPAGHFGYYGVAVYDGEVGEGDPTLYDPWAGHDAQPEEEDYRVITDVEAVGAAISLRALQLMVRETDPERAVEVSGDALSLCPRSPAVRAVRGAILLASGNPTEALAELEAAAQLRSDGPRHNLLAGLYIAQGEYEDAQREVTAALEEFPDFAGAHATLAALHLANAEPDEAEEELRTAERLDPNLHVLPGLWATFFAGTGELERAVDYARRSVEANAGDLQARLMAARIYRQAAEYDDMRREARAVLDATPAERRERMEELIRELLGPTALEAPDDEELSDEELEAAAEGSGELRLSLESGLLGDEDDALADEPLDAELDEDEGEEPRGEGGTTLMLGDPSSLSLGGGRRGGRGGSLGGGGGGLRLDMD
jgi:tetratricopeptide (TPR) repeat protein